MKELVITRQGQSDKYYKPIRSSRKVIHLKTKGKRFVLAPLFLKIKRFTSWATNKSEETKRKREKEKENANEMKTQRIIWVNKKIKK